MRALKHTVLCDINTTHAYRQKTENRMEKNDASCGSTTEKYAHLFKKTCFLRL
jgi:hypothetical protein